MQGSAMRNMTALVAALVVVVVLLGGTWLVAQPKITVKSPAGSTITAAQLADSSSAVTQQSTSDSTTLRVSAGYYHVVVTYHGAKQLFYGSVGVFQESTFQFTAPTAPQVSVVAQRVAYNAVKSGNSLAYLDTTVRAIAQIDQNGAVAGLDTTNLASLDDSNTGNAQGLYPVSGNKAVVLSNGLLYKLTGNKLTRLDTAGMPDDRNAIVVGTNPAQASFAVAEDQTVYWYDSVDATPRLLAKLPKRFDQLVVGGTTALAYSTRMPDSVENLKDSYNTTYAIDPILLDATSKKTSNWAIGPVVDVSISPDGTYATVLQQNASRTTVYKLAGMTALYDIQSPDTTTPVWTDNTHFVYGKSSDVWNFDAANSSGVSVGTLPNQLEPTSITYDQSGQSYYATTYDSVAGAAIYRLSPAIAATNSSAMRAAALAQQAQSNSTFSLSYVDIGQPTLRVTTTVALNNPSGAQFRSATLAARQAALAYIKGKGVDTTTVRVVFDPANL